MRFLVAKSTLPNSHTTLPPAPRLGVYKEFSLEKKLLLYSTPLPTHALFKNNYNLLIAKNIYLDIQCWLFFPVNTFCILSIQYLILCQYLSFTISYTLYILLILSIIIILDIIFNVNLYIFIFKTGEFITF